MLWMKFAVRIAQSMVLFAVLAFLYLTTAQEPLDLTASVWGVAWGLRMDLVATLLCLFVGGLGWVVTTYSLVNLRGQDRLGRLGGAFSVALLSLTILIAGASLPVMAVGWTLSGLAASFLVAHPNTVAARRAATAMRRAFAVGDAAVWALVALTAVLLPSLDRQDLPTAVAGLDWRTGSLLSGLLLVAFVARSALFPAQRWLVETTEAPSPISAFLHAGVVNGGGVLLLLLWPIAASSRSGMIALVLVGATSVVLGSWSMYARDDVKGRLACSTTTQMGFVAVQLGLGLSAAALLHVIGHGAWKAWLFLRASGAVDRFGLLSRVSPARRSLLLCLLPTMVAFACGGSAAYTLVEAAGPAGLVPLVLLLLFTLVAGQQLSALHQGRWVVEIGAGVLVGVLGACAAWTLLMWKEAVGGAFVVERFRWDDPAVWLLLMVVLAALILASAGMARLQRDRTGWLALAMFPTVLSPGLRKPAAARWPVLAQRPPSERNRAISLADVDLATVIATRVTGPTWPLASSVAVNPIRPLESIPFADAVKVVRRSHGAEIVPELRWFHERWSTGRITPSALLAAMSENEEDLAGFLRRSSIDDFVCFSHFLATRPVKPGVVPGSIPMLGEALTNTVARERTVRRVDQESGWWCQRAWADVETVGPGPWQRWRTAATSSTYGIASGLRGIDQLVLQLPTDPREAILAMVQEASIPGSSLVGYLSRLIGTAPGWTAHAGWRSERGESDALLEVLALRMALDLLHTAACGAIGLDLGPRSQGSVAAADLAATDAYRQVWQRALDLSAAEGLLPALVLAEAEQSGTSSRLDDPQSQSLWCIDVRSERMRRHLEATGRHETFGVAGFFGIATRHRDPDGRTTDQCPVLLIPSSSSHGEREHLSLRQLLHRTISATTSRSPAIALLSAEAFGTLAAAASVLSTVWPRQSRRLRQQWVHGCDATAPVDWLAATDTQADVVESVLRSVGLTERFAPLLLVVGHAATVENNAHQATYQCGACGANSGLVNARLFAAALNDPAVRRELGKRGIDLPETTVAVATVHDTGTDTVRQVCDDNPYSHNLGTSDLAGLEANLAEAGRRTAGERAEKLPGVRRRNQALDPIRISREVAHRSTDWSEPTPEWGLAGNRAIIVAPRRLSAGLDLGGRVFLQSYERSLDPDHQILEQLMLAPVVVSQWISAQYQFSTVAANVFGAGDKTTLNVIGNVGALQGAHGDLRVGLPWQSLFDRSPLERPHHAGAHEPTRHLVVLAAPKNAVLEIVRRHPTLHQLITNRWATFVVLDDGAHEITPDLTWRSLVPSSGHMPAMSKVRE